MGFYGKIYNTVKNTIAKITISNIKENTNDKNQYEIDNTIEIETLNDPTLGFSSGNRWILLGWDGDHNTVNICHQGTIQSPRDEEVAPEKIQTEIIGGYTPPTLGGTTEDASTDASEGTLGDNSEGTTGETLGEILDFNETISLPIIYYDSTGHITGVGSKEYTMPNIKDLRGQVASCVNEHEYIKDDITHIYQLIGATINDSFNKSLIERVNSLERNVNTLQSQVPSNLEKTLETLAGKIDNLEDGTSNTFTTINGLIDDIQDRVAKLEKAVESIGGLKDAIDEGDKSSVS